MLVLLDLVDRLHYQPFDAAFRQLHGEEARKLAHVLAGKARVQGQPGQLLSFGEALRNRTHNSTPWLDVYTRFIRELANLAAITYIQRPKYA